MNTDKLITHKILGSRNCDLTDCSVWNSNISVFNPTSVLISNPVVLEKRSKEVVWSSDSLLSVVIVAIYPVSLPDEFDKNGRGFL